MIKDDKKILRRLMRLLHCNFVIASLKIWDEKKKIVYLDQFAVSNMVSEISSIWIEAKEVLIHSVQSGKVICPIPMEHYIETGTRLQREAIKQDDFFIRFQVRHLIIGKK